ncbi:hypothetical protein Chor_006189, partial [Crotalus horridus]
LREISSKTIECMGTVGNGYGKSFGNVKENCVVSMQLPDGSHGQYLRICSQKYGLHRNYDVLEMNLMLPTVQEGVCETFIGFIGLPRSKSSDHNFAPLALHRPLHMENAVTRTSRGHEYCLLGSSNKAHEQSLWMQLIALPDLGHPADSRSKRTPY